MRELEDKQMPSASVIMAVYNAEEYLEEAIDSVLEQSFTDFELLLLNDGSTDNSPKILKSYADRDSRCKLHSFQNMGRAKIRNEGIKHVKGEVLFIMDADDVCLPNRFQVQMDYLVDHPECVAVGSRVILIDPEGLHISPYAVEISHEEIDAAHLAGKGGSICHPAVAIRKNAFVEIGGYRHEFPFAQDLDLFLRLATVGRLANIPEVLLLYRQHLTSAGYQNRVQQIELGKKAVTDAYEQRCLKRDAYSNEATITGRVPSLAEIYIKWGWWALSAGNLSTAKKYAYKSFVQTPWKIEAYRLLFCTIRGY